MLLQAVLAGTAVLIILATAAASSVPALAKPSAGTVGGGAPTGRSRANPGVDPRLGRSSHL